jgi:K+-transporting ATPase A subunit
VINSAGILQIVLFFVAILVFTKPLGVYMARVFEEQRTFLHPLLRPLERALYRLCGVDELSEQPWTRYAGAMLAGRFLMIVPLLAAAGSLAAKKRLPISAGMLPTPGPLFVGLLVGTVIIVGALTFFPALSLGPLAEQFLLHAGRLF